MEPQFMTWIIIAVVLGSIVSVGLRRTRKGKPVLDLRPGVAVHVVFDGALVGFATWGALLALDVPGNAAHWFVLGAIALLLADVGIRQRLARPTSDAGSPRQAQGAARR